MVNSLLQWVLSLLLALTLASRSIAVAATGCLTSSAAELKDYLKAHNIKRLVFFASWCSSCSKHLADLPSDSVLIGVFDEPRRLNALLEKRRIASPCFFGEELAKEYEVRALPAIRVLESSLQSKRE